MYRLYFSPSWSSCNKWMIYSLWDWISNGVLIWKLLQLKPSKKRYAWKSRPILFLNCHLKGVFIFSSSRRKLSNKYNGMKLLEVDCVPKYIPQTNGTRILINGNLLNKFTYAISEINFWLLVCYEIITLNSWDYHLFLMSN